MNIPNICMICGSNSKAGLTTVTVDDGGSLVVLRNIPAMVCINCGEELMDNETALVVEQNIKKVKSQKSQVEILAF